MWEGVGGEEGEGGRGRAEIMVRVWSALTCRRTGGHIGCGNGGWSCATAVRVSESEGFG